MACATLEEILKDCLNNSGGIYTLLINQQDNITEAVVDETGTNWQVTSITHTAPYVPLEFKRNTGSFTEDGTIDLVNGSSYVTQTINLMFHRRDQEKSRAIKVLGAGQQYLNAVVGDANGKFWYFPFLQVSAYGEGSGVARADGSKYSLTLLAENETLAYEVDPTIIAGLTV
tara:strand:- start:1042 stop:1557 length:516 start_codon:yes stop_codon:yes gene_type:complete